MTIWSVIVLVLLLAYVLYPKAAEEAAREGVTEIVYWTPMDPGIFDPMKPLIEEFEKRNRQYRVRLGTATARDPSDPTRLLLGVAGGMPPDVVYFNRPFIIEWASRGAFTDLGPFIEEDIKAGVEDCIRAENFYAITWEEPLYQGGNYAIANGTDARALFYCHEPLIRAGFTYAADDPAVIAGRARAGEARPPATWEAICRKRLHASARIEANGSVSLSAFVRRPAVNEGVPEGAAPSLAEAGVRAGDVAAIVAGTSVFRGRIASVEDGAHFTLDLEREQRAGLDAVPLAFRGEHEIKVYDQDDYMSRLNRFDPRTGRLTAAGFIPLFGNSWLYLYGWQNGARFMSEDGTRCLLDAPEIVEALQWLSDAYDAMGGQEAANVFQAAESSTGLDPFLTGAIAMRTDINDFLGVIAAFKPEHEFGVTPAPLPERSVAAGMTPFGWGAGWCYAIPATAKNKDGAWALVRWFSSFEANQMLYESQASLSRAKGQPFLPRMHPDKRIMAWIEDSFIEGNPNLSEHVVRAFRQFMELLPTNRHLPVTPVGQKLWTEHARASNAAINHLMPPHDALSYGQRRVQDTLEKTLHPPTGPLVNWPMLIALYAASVAALFGVLAWVQERRRKREGARRGRWFEGYIAASPWLVGFIVFGAGPVLFSFVIAFCHYDVLNPARFIGVGNFLNLIGNHFDSVTHERAWNDPIFWRSLGNTAFMILGVPLGIVAGLAIALLLDTKVRGLHVYRTLFYLPAIVPAVATFILWMWILEPSRGLLNQVLLSVGVAQPPNWLQDPAWSKPSLIIMGLWGAGAGMIIWLAGLKDIPQSLYEAASIDGANRVQRFFHITIPLLTPYIFYNLIMGMIGVFQIFEAAFVMTDGGPADSTLFYAYKLFNEAFRYLNMGVACAMAWILFLIVFVMTMIQLWLGKKWVHYGG